jgi:hypothetical protein
MEQLRIGLRHSLGCTLALALAACASSTPRQSLGPPIPTAEPAHASSITAADLIGLSVPEIRARLGGTVLRGEVGPSISMLADDGGVYSYLTVHDALADPALQQAWARGERGNPSQGDWSECRVTMTGTQYGYGALLVMRNGHVIEVRQPDQQPQQPSAPTTPLPGESQMEAFRRHSAERRAQPLRSYLLSDPGKMPLAEGPGFIAHWRGAPASPDDVIAANCRRLQRGPPVELPLPRQRAGGLSAGDMQTLALAPFVVVLPFINSDRTAALTEGPQTMALIQLGQPVPGGPAAFAQQHKRAFWYPGPDGYGILVFDLGMTANNNLSARGDLGFAGVRSGKVVWIAREIQPSGMGMSGNLLCLDERNVRANTRKGCTGYGNLNPGK